MEVRYSPMLHTRKGLRLTQVVEAVLAGLRRAQEDFGIESTSSSAASATSRRSRRSRWPSCAVAYKNRGVVGFDLAGAEYDHPAKHHKPPSSSSATTTSTSPSTRARPTAPSRSPRPSTSAARTASATAAACARTATCCTTSTTTASRSSAARRNVQTGAVREPRVAPAEALPDLGLRVTVNTDNRLITDTTVSKELWLCHTKMGLGLSDIKQIIVAGFKSAFLPFHSGSPSWACSRPPTSSSPRSPTRKS
jgi:adenosine deaminase